MHHGIGASTRRHRNAFRACALAVGIGGLALSALVLGRGIAPAQTKGPLVVSIWGGTTEEAFRKHVGARFTRETGVAVQFEIGPQNPRFNKIRAQKGSPTVDVFISSEDVVHVGIEQGLYEKITPANVPNLKKLHPWATPAPEYGAAYAVISYGIAYHTEKLKPAPTSWGDFWRPGLAKRIAFTAIAHTHMPALLVIVSEMNGGSQENVAPGLAKLAQLKPVKTSFFFTEWAPLLKTGDAWMSPEFDYYTNVMKDQGLPVEFVIPREGAIGTLQHLVVVKGTKHQELAEKFINVALSEEVQEAFAREIYNGPTNKLAKVEGATAAKIAYGDRLAKLRFPDNRFIARKRAEWTEKLNTEVAPNWR